MLQYIFIVTIIISHSMDFFAASIATSNVETDEYYSIIQQSKGEAKHELYYSACYPM